MHALRLCLHREKFVHREAGGPGTGAVGGAEPRRAAAIGYASIRCGEGRCAGSAGRRARGDADFRRLVRAAVLREGRPASDSPYGFSGCYL